MEIEFINHAAFTIIAAGLRILCDPWIDGEVFHNGWSLLALTKLRVQDSARVTHLWFSHEHPDHFNPPNLKRIPPEIRKEITVLYQATADGKVAQFCKGLGFKVQELPPGQRTAIADRVSVLCQPVRGMEDSWLHVSSPDGSVLNLNDCEINDREQARAIKRAVGPVDLLATQFSLSAWDGNAEEKDRRRAGAHEMLERAVMQTQELAPRYVLPFASFVWFCHEENAYMNDGVVSVAEAAQALAQRTSALPVVMYPGDVWTPGGPSPTAAAVERWERDRQSLSGRPLHRGKPVAADALVAASREFCHKLLEHSDRSRLRVRWAVRDAREPRAGRGRLGSVADLARLRIRPARVFVPDLAQSFDFDPFHGLSPADRERADCEVEIGSEALAYAFKFLWGGQTLLINGRFREIRPGGREPLFRYFHAAASRSAGRTARWNTLGRDMARRLGRHLRRT